MIAAFIDSEALVVKVHGGNPRPTLSLRSFVCGIEYQLDIEQSSKKKSWPTARIIRLLPKIPLALQSCQTLIKLFQ